MYVYIYVHIYIYICLHIECIFHTHAHTHKHTHVHAFVFVCVCVCLHVQIYRRRSAPTARGMFYYFMCTYNMMIYYVLHLHANMHKHVDIGMFPRQCLFCHAIYYKYTHTY